MQACKDIVQYENAQKKNVLKFNIHCLTAREGSSFEIWELTIAAAMNFCII